MPNLNNNTINRSILAIVLLSALIVIVARTLGPIELQWDGCIQMESAHRLVNGLGLTSTYFAVPHPDLVKPPEPLGLTWFPPGFSVLLAGMLFLKLPLAASLKIIYGFLTFVGWIGWGLIAGQLLCKPIKIGSFYASLNYIVAFILPLFYTPAWKGTDSFLWAGIPFVIMLLFYSGASGSRKKSLIAIAGILSGFLFAFRYASIFIPVMAFFIILQVNLDNPKRSLKYYFLFLLSFVTIILPVVVRNHIVSGTIGLPRYITLYGFHHIGDTFRRIFTHLFTASSLFGIGDLSKVASHAHPDARNFFYGILYAAFILSLPLIIIRAKKICTEEIKKDLSLSVSLACIALIIVLTGCMFLNYFDFLSRKRYFLSMGPAAIFIFYSLASSGRPKAHVKRIFAAFIAVFVFYNIFCLSGICGIKRQRSQAAMLIGYNYRRNPQYLTNEIVSRCESSFFELKKLEKSYPGAIFFVQNQPFYVYNDGNSVFRIIPGGKPGSMFRRVTHGDIWKKAYIGKPAKIFWVTDINKSDAIFSSGDPRNPIKELLSLPGTKKISEFPNENTKIMVSDLPAGYKFATKE